MAKVGRPKLTPEDHFPKNWKEKVLSLYSLGASDVEIRVLLDISNDTFYRLLKEDDEFAETIKRGHDFCQAWWELEGRQALRDKSFNPVLWYMNMKNRFGWADKKNIDHTTGGDKLNINMVSYTEANDE